MSDVRLIDNLIHSVRDKGFCDLTDAEAEALVAEIERLRAALERYAIRPNQGAFCEMCAMSGDTPESILHESDCPLASPIRSNETGEK